MSALTHQQVTEVVPSELLKFSPTVGKHHTLVGTQPEKAAVVAQLLSAAGFYAVVDGLFSDTVKARTFGSGPLH